MRIAFSSTDDWLDELDFVCKEDPDECPRLVRLCTEKVPASDKSGQAYNSIIVCASFVYDDLLYELLIDCGEQYINIRMGDGQKESEQVESRIREKCSELDVTVRRGRLDLNLT